MFNRNNDDDRYKQIRCVFFPAHKANCDVKVLSPHYYIFKLLSMGNFVENWNVSYPDCKEKWSDQSFSVQRSRIYVEVFQRILFKLGPTRSPLWVVQWVTKLVAAITHRSSNLLQKQRFAEIFLLLHHFSVVSYNEIQKLSTLLTNYSSTLRRSRHF